MKPIGKSIFFIIIGLFLSGCGANELENRGFPLAIGIDKSEEGIILTFDFPDLAEVSDGKTLGGEKGNLSVEAQAYYEAQKAYENNMNKMLDYNHLKAIVIGENFLADGQAVRELFAWLEGEDVVARNTVLFIAQESAESILNLSDESFHSVGKYLEQMVERQEDFKNNKIMTIGKLMNQWHNQNELLLIPVLSNNGGLPCITEYAVVDYFVYKGNISVEDSMKAFLSQGLLKSFDYKLKDGSIIDIQNIKTNTKIEEDGLEALITVNIKGNGLIKKEGNKGTIPIKKMKKNLDNQLKTSMTDTAKRLLEESSVDMVNSYIMLGGHNRKLYQIYENRWPEYSEHISIQYDIDMTIVNE